MEVFLLLISEHKARIKVDNEEYSENINREKFNIQKTHYFINISRTLFDTFQQAAIIGGILAALDVITIGADKLVMLPIIILGQIVKHSTKAFEFEKCLYDAVVALKKESGKDKIPIEDLVAYYKRSKMSCETIGCRFNKDKKCCIESDHIGTLLKELEKKEIIKKAGFNEWTLTF
jgi:hypothetical protein